MAELSKPDAPRSAFWLRAPWWQLPLLALAAALAVGLYTYLFAGREYTARTSLLLNDTPDVVAMMVNPEAAGMAAGSSGILDFMGRTGPLSRLQTTLKSRTLRQEIVRRYALVQRLNLRDDEQALKALDRLIQITTIDGPGLEIKVTLPGPSRLGEWTGATRPFSTREAKDFAASLANDYVALLDQAVTRGSVQEARFTREFLSGRIAQVTQELEDVEDRLQVIQTEYRLLDPEQKAEEMVKLATSLYQSLAEATAQAEGLGQSARAGRGELGAQETTRIAREVTERNPVLMELEKRRAELQTELARELESGKAPSHPEVQALQAAMDSIDDQLKKTQRDLQTQVWREANPVRDEAAGKVIGLEVELAGAQARQAALEREVGKLEGDLASLPPVALQYLRLVREQTIKTELLATLSKYEELAGVEEQRQRSGKFRVLDAAVPPLRKSGPPTVRMTLATFLLFTLILSLYTAHRRGYLRPGFLE